MKPRENTVYEFGPFRLDTAEGALLRQGQPIPLAPKAFEILVVLVRNAGHLLGKDELMQAVWPDTFVEEGNLKVNISALRKALGDTSEEPAFIETIPRRGYRFLPTVSVLEPATPSLLTTKPMQVVVERRTLSRTITEEEEINEGTPAPAGPALPAPALPALPASLRISRMRKLRLLAVAGMVVLASAAGVFGYLTRFRGNPVRVTLAGRKLQGWDAKEALAWEYQFKEPMEFAATAGGQGALFADLAGDGHRAVLLALAVAGHSIGPEMQHSALYCFSDKGKLLWIYDPDVKFRFESQEYGGPWSLSAVTLVREGNRDTVWVAFDHPTWWPAFVARIDPSGNAEVRFLNSGRIWFLKELRRPDGTFLLAAGTNNEFMQASVAVLATNEAFSMSPQTAGNGYWCQSCEQHWVAYYLLFPRSEIYGLQNVPFHLVQALDVTADGFTLRTLEGTDQTIQMADTDLLAFYQISSDLQKVSGALGDTYWRLHRRLEREGKIHHRAEDCPDQTIARRIRLFTRLNGWWNPGEAANKPASSPAK